MDNALELIAHMGACTKFADNSYEALQLAVLEGADMIELDLRRTRDGAIVVIHDQTTHRMFGSGGTIAEMSLCDVQALRGRNGERIATLEEALTLPLPLIHEFKVTGLEAELAAAISGARPNDIVSSFNHQSLERLRAIDPAIRIGYLWFQDDWAAVLAKAADLGAYSVHPSNYDVCPELVADAKEKGLKVYVWSVDDSLRAGQLRDWGVDGIMTYSPGSTRSDFAKANLCRAARWQLQ